MENQINKEKDDQRKERIHPDNLYSLSSQQISIIFFKGSNKHNNPSHLQFLAH